MIVLTPAVILAFVLLQAAPSVSVSPPMAQSQEVSNARAISLTLPHILRQGETAWLVVKTGAIGHNQIQLTTQDGRPLGTISASGIRSGQPAGTYTIPVPAEAFQNGRLALRLSITQSSRILRAPTATEVKSLRLLIRRFKDGN